MKIVVDTSILIDSLRGGVKWEEFLKGLSPEVELYIPTIVIFELFSGHSTKNIEVRQKVEDIIRYLRRVELTEEIARGAGQLYREVSQKLEVPDYIIAASALQINAEVATLNKKHFEQIPNINIFPLP